MIDEIFVFDNVVHMFNASEEQIINPYGRDGQEHWLELTDSARPRGDNERYGGEPSRYSWAKE